jgi:hypothetical protein
VRVGIDEHGRCVEMGMEGTTERLPDVVIGVRLTISGKMSQTVARLFGANHSAMRNRSEISQGAAPP